MKRSLHLLATVYLRHTVHRLFDLDWTTAGYVTMTQDEDGYAWIEWIDQLHFTFPNNGHGKLAGIRPRAARMSVASAIAWAAEGTTDTGRTEIWRGLVSLDGYRSFVDRCDARRSPLARLHSSTCSQHQPRSR